MSPGALFAAKPIPGPKGGRILNTAPHFAESFIGKDSMATVTFYDANMKPSRSDARFVGGVVALGDSDGFARFDCAVWLPAPAGR